jgi:hypothetical protein
MSSSLVLHKRMRPPVKATDRSLPWDRQVTSRSGCLVSPSDHSAERSTPRAPLSLNRASQSSRTWTECGDCSRVSKRPRAVMWLLNRVKSAPRRFSSPRTVKDLPMPPSPHRWKPVA